MAAVEKALAAAEARSAQAGPPATFFTRRTKKAHYCVDLTGIFSWPLAPATFSALGRALVQQGRLVQADATAIQLEAAQGRRDLRPAARRLEEALRAGRLASSRRNAFGYPLLDLNAVDIDQLPLNLIDNKIVANHRVIALGKRGNRIFVGMSDPTNEQVMQEVKFATGMTMEPVVVEDDKLSIDRARSSPTRRGKTLEMATEDVDLSGVEVTDGEAQPDVVTEEIDDAPVVKYVQKILLDAINGGASDIHFEPYEKFYRIRYRTDGILYDVAQPPLAIKEKIASRIKVVSQARHLGEARAPGRAHEDGAVQDARHRLPRLARCRRSSARRSACGSSIPSSATLGIEALGYEPGPEGAPDERHPAPLRHGAGHRARRARARRCRSTPASTSSTSRASTSRPPRTPRKSTCPASTR